MDKLAEIKYQFKKETDQEKLAEKDALIAEVKADAESEKAQRVLEAKEKLKKLKKELKQDKQNKLDALRNQFKAKRSEQVNKPEDDDGIPDTLSFDGDQLQIDMDICQSPEPAARKKAIGLSADMDFLSNTDPKQRRHDRTKSQLPLNLLPMNDEAVLGADEEVKSAGKDQAIEVVDVDNLDINM